ncbi:hypothetical protein CC2G_002626 [Coprinopsis cinerea AmutBmut pab1-1]|nr:hypothetical protein CC2G_002626 [Coprinopsis cinerea AmutBmut pab1-1]
MRKFLSSLSFRSKPGRSEGRSSRHSDDDWERSRSERVTVVLNTPDSDSPPKYEWDVSTRDNSPSDMNPRKWATADGSDAVLPPRIPRGYLPSTQFGPVLPSSQEPCQTDDRYPNISQRGSPLAGTSQSSQPSQIYHRAAAHAQLTANQSAPTFPVPSIPIIIPTINGPQARSCSRASNDHRVRSGFGRSNTQDTNGSEGEVREVTAKLKAVPASTLSIVSSSSRGVGRSGWSSTTEQSNNIRSPISTPPTTVPTMASTGSPTDNKRIRRGTTRISRMPSPATIPPWPVATEPEKIPASVRRVRGADAAQQRAKVPSESEWQGLNRYPPQGGRNSQSILGSKQMADPQEDLTKVTITRPRDFQLMAHSARAHPHRTTAFVPRDPRRRMQATAERDVADQLMNVTVTIGGCITQLENITDAVQMQRKRYGGNGWGRRDTLSSRDSSVPNIFVEAPTPKTRSSLAGSLTRSRYDY